MKNKILLLLLLLLPGLVFSQNSPVFYKISGNGLAKPSYLFISFSNNDPITYNLGDSVYMALNEVKAVATELITDSLQKEQLKELMTLPEGRTFLSHVNNMKFGAVDEQFYKLKSESLWDYNQYQPLYLKRLLRQANARYAGGQSVEEFLVMLAGEQGKKIIPLYNPQELQKLYDQVPLVLQIDILMDYVQSLRQKEATAPILLNAYLNGDVLAILNWIKQNRHYEYYHKINRVKADDITRKAIQMIKAQPTFLIIDAQYLAGEKGLLNELYKMDYHLTAIHTGFNNAQFDGTDIFSSTKTNSADSIEYYDLNSQYTEAYFKQTIPKWEKIVSHQGAFVVRMPEQPEIAVERMPTDNDALTVHLYKSEDKAINTFYLVSYYDYPETFRPERQKDFFREIISRVVRRMGGSLLVEKNISTPQFQAREIEVQVDSDYFVRAKFYLVGNRLYQVIIGASGRRAYSEENEAYLNSFKLINQEKDNWFKLNLGPASVMMPQEPDRVETTKGVRSTDIKVFEYSASEVNTGIEYLVSYSFYPESFAVKDLTNFYNSIAYQAAVQMEGFLLRDREVKSGNAEGRYMEIVTKDDRIYRLIVYYFNNRLLQVMLTGNEDAAFSTYADKFLKNYQLSTLEY